METMMQTSSLRKALFLLLWIQRTSIVKGEIRKLQENELPLFDVIIPNSVDPLFTSLNITADATTNGMWSAVFPWPINSIHSIMMPDGKLINYGKPPKALSEQGRVFVIWDPTLGINSNSYNISLNRHLVQSYCNSHGFLSDGKDLLIAGGGQTFETIIFDSTTGVATLVEPLTYPRWYGTLTKVPDGRFLMTGGSTNGLADAWTDPIAAEPEVSSTPEIYTEGEGWATLPGARSLDAFGAESNRFYYPRQWVSPRGTVFGISTDKMWELSLEGNASIKILGDFKTKPDVKPDSVTPRPNVGPSGTAAMFDKGKILMIGGNGRKSSESKYSSKLATVVDINDLHLGKVYVNDTSPMTNERQWANAMVLPDGKVLVTGGTRGGNLDGENAVLPVEIWDPRNGKWIIGAPAARYRGYHSSAALLPNGAVFSSGGGQAGPVLNRNVEIYYPPYLFTNVNGTPTLANRPRIISVSSLALKYKQTLSIQVAGNITVSEVSITALPMATHGYDNNQRRLKLSSRINPGVVQAKMPSKNSLAPDGYYYLNVLFKKVPSISVIIGIGNVQAL